MRNAVSLNDFFDSFMRDLNRVAVGYEPSIRMLDNIRTSGASTSFPPYDLEKLGDNHYRLSMAVAGYAPQDIDITVHDGMLTVEGKVANQEDRTFLYKGIAGRSFRRVFALAQYIEVSASSLENGILTIDFVQEVPEKLKPKKIEIGYKPTAELTM